MAEEYTGKMAKKTLVLGREKLFQGEEFEGFRVVGKGDLLTRLIEKGYWEIRGRAEKPEARLKHPIPYIVIVNQATKKIFSYLRANDTSYTEERLRGKFSVGVGGHIDEADEADESGMVSREEMISNALMRELNEEVELVGGRYLGKPLQIGIINDNSDSVGMVHLGLAYIITTNAIEVRPRDKEIREGKLRTKKETEEMLRTNPEISPEGWTKIIMPEIWKRVM
ncbi:hypothetical protein COU61_01025 [Candidatus Pacearchaeota archaeon CG10_big_fil_rev_8_21_14_0_10_35_13]|nr:MAG: hypothetical protein COU61_01025 [Candidatus Pacearchaeota archaeon CG10_big_fil_rev_8_21_14_0_10_35_13]